MPHNTNLMQRKLNVRIPLKWALMKSDCSFHSGDFISAILNSHLVSHRLLCFVQYWMFYGKILRWLTFTSPACLCVLFYPQRCPFVSYGTPSRRLHFSRPWRLLLSNYNPDHCFATLHLLGRKQKETIARPVRERSAAHSPSPSPIQLCTRHGAHKWRKFKSLNIN